MNYLITGLPRSRTAWLAAVLSTPESPCLHEGEGLLGTVDRTIEWLTAHPGSGNSSSGMPYDWRAYHEGLRTTGYKLVVIDRGIQEAADALEKALEGEELPVSRRSLDEAFRHASRALSQWTLVKHKPAPLVVPFRGLEDVDTIRTIMEYVRPGSKISNEWIESMQGLRVTQRIRHVYQRNGHDWAG